MLPCPRRIESSLGAYNPHEDHWVEGETCSWCGSLNPDLLLRRLEQGGGEFLFRHKKRIQGTRDDYEWVTETRKWAKFYFQHFTQEQRTHFVQLLNDKRIKLGPPGYFYRLPFFISYTD